MTSGTRPCGLPGVTLHAGEHICAFHAGKRERDDILVPFLREGVQAGEKCLAVLDEHDASPIRDSVLDGLSRIEAAPIGQLDLKTLGDRADRSEGEFSPDELLEFWDSHLAPGFRRDEIDDWYGAECAAV
jgi:hypothetical protein